MRPSDPKYNADINDEGCISLQVSIDAKRRTILGTNILSASFALIIALGICQICCLKFISQG
jgi:hypothetical protein